MAALQAWKSAIPDVTGEVVRVLAEGDTAVLEIIWRGTQAGAMHTPDGDLPASGKWFEMWASMWQQWEGGKLAQERHHLDILSMLAQLGALPAPAA